MRDKRGPAVLTHQPGHFAPMRRDAVPVNQHEAPRGMVATIGHPANKILIVKTNEDLWRYVDSGKPVDDEHFRGGWDDYVPDQGET